MRTGSPICHFENDQERFNENLRKGFRASAVSVSILTTRDEEGQFHGLAVTSAAPVCMAPPSMMVAVSQAASSYPAIQGSQLFCLNNITSGDLELLDRFSRSDLRASRFSSQAWQSGLHGLPYLETATSSFFCRVIGAHEYGDHSVFVGRVEGVRVGDSLREAGSDPLIWMNGAPRRLAEREFA
jgi:flavin reductase (DIM6/NTAB) family NADH-FMN oxidoreductase RutF